MALSDVNTAMIAAQAALASADYATALDHAIAAQGYLAAVADFEHGRGIRNEWDRRSIEQFIQNLRTRRDQAAVASSGIQRTKIVYAQPSAAE